MEGDPQQAWILQALDATPVAATQSKPLRTGGRRDRGTGRQRGHSVGHAQCRLCCKNSGCGGVPCKALDKEWDGGAPGAKGLVDCREAAVVGRPTRDEHGGRRTPGPVQSRGSRVGSGCGAESTGPAGALAVGKRREQSQATPEFVPSTSVQFRKKESRIHQAARVGGPADGPTSLRGTYTTVRSLSEVPLTRRERPRGVRSPTPGVLS